MRLSSSGGRYCRGCCGDGDLGGGLEWGVRRRGRECRAARLVAGARCVDGLLRAEHSGQGEEGTGDGLVVVDEGGKGRRGAEVRP